MLDVRRGPDMLAVTMEHVEGVSLARSLERSGALKPWQALRLAYQVGETLRYLHEQGVVHRDVAPGNLMITPKGNVRLIDFGLAAPLGVARADVGTPGYRAPEQETPGAVLSEKSDIYGFGVTLHRLLTAELPQERTPREDLASGLRALLSRCLDLDPQARPSARELRQALHELEAIFASGERANG